MYIMGEEDVVKLKIVDPKIEVIWLSLLRKLEFQMKIFTFQK